MSLLAVPDLLPTLIRRPGLTTWIVQTSTNTPAPYPGENDEEEEAARMAGKKVKKWPKTLWPNGKESERGMDRCLRIYPHLQDTGAFFVSVMVKAGEEIIPPPPVCVLSLRYGFSLGLQTDRRLSLFRASTSTIAIVTESVKRTVDERAASPIAGEPSTKRTKSEEEDSDSALVSLPKVDLSDDVDVSTLPAEIVGTVNRAPAEFKEEPYIYLSPQDEQVKMCMYVVLSIPLMLSPNLTVVILITGTSSIWIRHSPSPLFSCEMRLAPLSVRFTSLPHSFDLYSCRIRILVCG